MPYGHDGDGTDIREIGQAFLEYSSKGYLPTKRISSSKQQRTQAGEKMEREEMMEMWKK